MKTSAKVMVVALVVSLSINLLAQPYEGEKGDVNNDGDINVLDIIVTGNHILGIATLHEQELWRADCNSHKGSCRGDGSIDILDAMKIVDIIIRFDECLELLKNIDGNIYEIVIIGDRVWMAENLKVTHYRNGDPIPNVTSDLVWNSLTTGARCDFDNDANNWPVYGRLYNWYAVNDSREIAPEGWHIPTDEEWKQLEMHLGMSQSQVDSIGWRGADEGGQMKEAGASHWNDPNTGATNSSGFTALPAGYRDYGGSFLSLGYYASFWSATVSYSSFAWLRTLSYYYAQVGRFSYGKDSGFSVRCLLD